MATYFRYSLVELLRVTLDGHPHFIRCIKPNHHQKSFTWDDDLVTRQIKYTGLMEIIKARRQGYTHRLSFADFLKRYCFLGYAFDERVTATRDCVQVLLLRLKMDGYAIGRTKVFLKYYHIEYLAKTYENYMRKIVRVQSAVRCWLGKIKFRKQR